MISTQIILDIKDIIESLTNSPAFPFLYADKYEANWYDNQQFPAGILFEIKQSGFQHYQSGAVKDKYKIIIFFCDKAAELTDTAVNNDSIIKAMLDYARSFTISLNRSRLYEKIDTFDIQHITNEFDGILTGVMLSFEIKMFESSSIC